MKCSNCNGDFTHEQAFIEHHCPRTSPPALLGSQPPRAPKLLRTPPPERADIPPIQGDWNNATQEQIGQTLLERVWKRYPEIGSDHKERLNNKWKSENEEWKRLQAELVELKREEYGTAPSFLAHLPQGSAAVRLHKEYYEKIKAKVREYEAKHPNASNNQPPFSEASIQSSHRAILKWRSSYMDSLRSQSAFSGNFQNSPEQSSYGAEVLNCHSYKEKVKIVKLMNNDGSNAYMFTQLPGDTKSPYVNVRRHFNVDFEHNLTYWEGKAPEEVTKTIERMKLFRGPDTHIELEGTKTDKGLEKRRLVRDEVDLTPAEKKKIIVNREIGGLGINLSSLNSREFEGFYNSIKKGVPANDLKIYARYLLYIKSMNPQEQFSRETSRNFIDQDFKTLSKVLKSKNFQNAYEKFKAATSPGEKAHRRDTLVTMLQYLHSMTYDSVQTLTPRRAHPSRSTPQYSSFTSGVAWESSASITHPLRELPPPPVPPHQSVTNQSPSRELPPPPVPPHQSETNQSPSREVPPPPRASSPKRNKPFSFARGFATW